MEKVIVALNKTFPADGLLPIYINPDTATGSYSTITFGAMGDRYLPFENQPSLIFFFYSRFCIIVRSLLQLL